jgi:dTDP-4-amino-4,6-dideoxygalactose transaminase
MQVSKLIPFNKAVITGNELLYIAEAVSKGDLKGDGPFTKKCHQWLEKKFETPKALLTHSCTAALEIAAILANIKEGDEVIMPSFTFTSTANAFVLRGAKPVFCDIRSDTLNVDESLIENLITKKTKAIVAVHYAGVGCEMDRIMEIANEHNLLVVEDAAHAMFSKYKNRWLGTIGDISAFSFHETKNLSSGEGGAILLNRDGFVNRAEVIREKGTNRSQFFRGETDKYSWVDIGSNYLPSELVAAFLFGQLEQAEKIQNKRLNAWNRYQELLQPLQEKQFFRLPIIPNYCEHNAHMFYLILESKADRSKLLDHCKKNNIEAVFHYIPLHSSAMGKRLCTDLLNLPQTEDLASRIVRLPLFYGITEEEQISVCSVVNNYFTSK